VPAVSHVIALASWNADTKRLVFDEPTVFHARIVKLGPGAGERFIVRVEREEEAKRYHRLKWLYGYVIKQCVEHTGHTAAEIELEFRARFLPPDVPTISLMTDEQMRDFNIQCEHFAAETIGIEIIGPDDARHYSTS
jgi:hypothetical protein